MAATEVVEIDRTFGFTVHREPGGQVSPSAEVSWCIPDTAYRAELERLEHKPYVGIVVVSNAQETGRYVVPLENLAARITFRRPGDNQVFMFITWRTPGMERKRDPRHVILKRDRDGHYEHRLIEVYQPEVEAVEAILQQLNTDLRKLDAERDRLGGLLRPIAVNQPQAPVSDDPNLTREYELRQEIATAQEALRVFLCDINEVDQEAVKGRLEEIAAERAVLMGRIEQQRAHVSELRETAPEAARLVSHPGGFHAGVGGHVAEQIIELDKPLFGGDNRLIKYLAEIHDWPGVARDDCHLRKRATANVMSLPFYGSFKLVHLLASMLTMFACVIVGAWAGLRNMDFSPLRHPLHGNPTRVLYAPGPSIWITKFRTTGSDPKKYELRHPFWRVFNPITIGLVLLVGFALKLGFGSATGLHVLSLVLLIASLIAAVAGRRIGAYIKSLDEKQEDRQDRQRRELERLSCTPGEPFDIGEVPLVQRVRLRASRAKGLVCKPIAQ